MPFVMVEALHCDAAESARDERNQRHADAITVGGALPERVSCVERSHGSGAVARTTLTALALLLAAGAGPAYARPLNVTVLSIACFDACRNTGLEGAGESAPDFYAKVFINGVEHTTPRAPDDQEAVAVDFRVTQEVADTVNDVPITVQVWDYDSTSGDDLGDASPVVGKANLDIVFHRDTGAVTGDVTSPIGLVCSSGQPGGEPGGGIFGADPKPAVTVCFSVRDDVDTDGDGLYDSWETDGIDQDGDGSIDVTLPDADPMHKDIYVWVDYMDCAVAGGDCASGDTHNHAPAASVMTDARNAFANAPVANPDGTTGINLHVQTGNPIKHFTYAQLGACTPDPCNPPDNPSAIHDFDTLKSEAFGANNARRFAYHYAIFGHAQFRNPGSSGCAELPGNDLLVTLGGWSPVDGGTAAEQTGTLMHELGHNLGLRHGGSVNTNYKPNYFSTMNYAFQMRRLDYSRNTHIRLDENALDERAGIGGAAGEVTFRWNFAVGSVDWLPGSGAVDWNGNGQPSDVGVTVNVNGDYDDANTNCSLDPGEQTFATLVDNDDWGSLHYNFRDTADFADGVHSGRIPEPEQTLEQHRAITLPDIRVSASASPDPVLTGSNVTYTIRVANVGGSPAAAVVVRDALPSSLTFVSCAATGDGVCSGTGNDRTITFASLDSAASAQITLVANVTCALPNGLSIANTVSASSDTPERYAADNSATALVTTSNPPPVIANLSVSQPIIQPAPNHMLVSEVVSYTVTDNCGPISSRLTVTSNEPINGLGDGDQSPDWVVSDDHNVQLRAERSGTGTGRIYTITVTATDSASNASTKAVTVLVPLNQRK
jgi:uncharacterized repeat protein (TIGR01451 family)